MKGRSFLSPKLYHYLPGDHKRRWPGWIAESDRPNPIEGDANGLVYGYFSGVYKPRREKDQGRAVTLFQADGVQIITRWTTMSRRPSDRKINDGEASSSVDNTDLSWRPRSPTCRPQGGTRCRSRDYLLVGRSTNGTDISSTKAPERATFHADGLQ